MSQAIARAHEAIEDDKAGNLVRAIDGYLATATQLNSWLEGETDPTAVKAVRERVLCYVERAEAVRKRMAQREWQFQTHSARLWDPEDPNVFFYQGQIRSQPNGDFVDYIHEWKGDWEKLEEHHGYIQWLFPYFEPAGMNGLATPLSKSGAAIIRQDYACQMRVLNSYKMMLDFYGFRLADHRTGRVERVFDEQKFRERADNCNKRCHNWLRISRILTSLGQLGFQRYKRPFFERLQKEVEEGTLADAAGSCTDFWRPLVYEEASESYKKKTLEEPEDRAEGCLFLRPLDGSLTDFDRSEAEAFLDCSDRLAWASWSPFPTSIDNTPYRTAHVSK